MSQRGSASLPVSRGPSQSPLPLPSPSARVLATRPTPSAIQDATPHNPATNPPEMASNTTGQSTSQRSRTFDVHHMISNPADFHMNVSKTPPGTLRPNFESRTAPAGHNRVVSEPPLTSQQPQYQQSPPYPPYQRPQLGVSPPAASPLADRAVLGIPGRGRASPTVSSPLTPLHYPRSSLGSQLPRAQSGHNPMPGMMQSHLTSPIIPSAAGQKRPFEGEIKQETSSPSTRVASSSYFGSSVPQMTLPPASTALQTASRSFSQPMHSNIAQQGLPAQGGAWPQTQQSGQFQGGWEPQRDTPHGELWFKRLVEEQNSQEPSRGVVQQRGRGRGTARARLGTSRAPGSPKVSLQIDIPGVGLSDLPIDMKSGSKEQGRKRLGGATASAKSRQRKRSLEEAERKCEQLEEELGRMRQQLQEIYGYREAYEYYRRERDRLRDIVARTPGISEAARGPPSPELRTMAHPTMFSSSAPLSLPPPPPPSTHATGLTSYVSSETSIAERPTQRRRTDGALESRPLLHSQHPQPQHHESFPTPSGYSHAMPPSRPGSASSTHILPSLRSFGASGMEASSTQGRHYGGQATHETGFHYPPREPDGGRGPR